MNVRRRWSALLTCTMLLAACGGPPTAGTSPIASTGTAASTAASPVASAASGTPVSGGSIIVGTPQEPASLNPLLASATIEDAIGSLFTEGLVQIDATGAFTPVLAEELPAVSEDGLTVTYKLKRGVTFSNGDPFTCADVQYTREAILSELSQVSTSGYSAIDAIDCPDEHTAIVRFGKLYAPYLRLFSYILPRAAGDVKQLDTWAFNRAPIGTGPWLLKEWKSGDSLALARNPAYREQGKPYLDAVNIKILPSREVGVQLLGTGEIDVLWDLTEADFPTLKALEPQGVGYAAAVTGENELLVLNLADPAVDAPPDAAQSPHPILSDLRVRQAMQQGIDRQAIAAALLYGNVQPGSTLLPVGQFACPGATVTYNPEAAKALLEQSGWQAGADGIRVKDGRRMELKIQTTSGNKLREDTQQVLVEQMKALGIELRIENVPSDVLFAGWGDNGLRKHGRFDIVLYTTGPGIDPDSHLFANYHSASIPTAENTGDGSNYSRYRNATVDQELEKAAATTDLAARKEAYCKANAQILTDLPRIPLYERLSLSGYRTRIQNFKVSPGPSDFTVGSESWWLQP